MYLCLKLLAFHTTTGLWKQQCWVGKCCLYFQKMTTIEYFKVSNVFCGFVWQLWWSLKGTLGKVKHGMVWKLIPKSDFSLSLQLWCISRHQEPITPGKEPQCQVDVQGKKMTDSCFKPFNCLLFIYLFPWDCFQQCGICSLKQAIYFNKIPFTHSEEKPSQVDRLQVIFGCSS